MTRDRTVKTSELVDAAAIADRLGVRPNTVHTWARRYPDFPKVVTDLSVGHIWLWSEVAAWHRRRKPGQPGSSN